MSDTRVRASMRTMGLMLRVKPLTFRCNLNGISVDIQKAKHPEALPLV